jgi:hypothetical protein
VAASRYGAGVAGFTNGLAAVGGTRLGESARQHVHVVTAIVVPGYR